MAENVVVESADGSFGDATNSMAKPIPSLPRRIIYNLSFHDGSFQEVSEIGERLAVNTGRLRKRSCASCGMPRGDEIEIDHEPGVDIDHQLCSSSDDEQAVGDDDTASLVKTAGEEKTHQVVNPIPIAGSRKTRHLFSTPVGILSSSAPLSSRSNTKYAGYSNLQEGPPTPDLEQNHKLVVCIHGNQYGTPTCCKSSANLTYQSALSKSTGALSNAFPTSFRRESVVEHCHRARDNSGNQKARRRLIFASLFCVFFMIAEIIGGALANSLAIATDAAHLLTDFASFMISLFSLWVATRPATKTMSFGWYRAEVIGALTSVLMIWVVTGILVYLAIERIVEMNFEIEANVMLITSGIGVLVNIVMGFTLHQHGHSHGGGSGHGHSHGGAKNNKNNNHVDTQSKEPQSNVNQSEDPNVNVSDSVGIISTHPDADTISRVVEQQTDIEASHDSYHSDQSDHHGGGAEEHNINVRAAFIHVLGDFIQSLGVFIAALIIFFKPSWVIVDPICTFLFSVLVLVTTFAIMKDTLTVLMEGLPKEIDFGRVRDTFMEIDGVVKVHNLRIWALSMDKVALSAHLAIRPGVGARSVLKHASRLVRSRFSFFEMTLQIEDFREEMEQCTECQPPAD